jgi:hypothetical protein
MEKTPSDIILLPMWSIYEDEDEHEHRTAVRVIRQSLVVCNLNDPEERCDRTGIHYSGWTYEGGPDAEILCPRHWYERHFRCHTHCRLEDMTSDDYDEQLLAFAAYRLTKVREFKDHVNVVANRLALLGFQQEADTLYRSTGAIEVIARQNPHP